MGEIDLRKVLFKFNIDVNAVPYGEGHINDTYFAQVEGDRYILQRINTNVFREPERVMENIVAITKHLRGKIVDRGGDPNRETLTFVKTIDKNTFCRAEDGNYFRMYRFVEDTVSYQSVKNAELFYNSAKAFGRFQNDLADFPAEELFETIPNFHDTRIRFDNLLKAIEENSACRKDEVGAEIEFALSRQKYTGVVVDAIAAGEVPLRVTHNDTKLNNVLFDKRTDEGICVIDLDTVMPGSLLYDFGDSIRFGASTAAEDEKDLDKVQCDLTLFEAFTKGFLEELKGVITPKEVELLAFSAILMTYECGIRFLTDYLNGDTYFKIHYPTQNLDRCRTQFKLVADMEKKMEQMNEIVKKYV